MGLLFNDTLFLEGADTRSRNIGLYLFTIDNQSFLLNIWLEDFAGFVLGKADVMSVHLAFSGDFTFCHRYHYTRKDKSSQEVV